MKGPDRPPPERPVKKTKEPREESPGRRKRKRSLDDHLKENLKRATGAEGGDDREAGRRSQGDSRRSRRSKKKKRTDRKRSGSKSSSASYYSSGSSPFHSSSVRGGELWRIAQKKPGRLTERSLNEMTRYLADRSELGQEDLSWAGQKVVAYLNQIVLVANPPAKIGLRSHRELVTLAMAIDELLSGQVKRGLDLLVQRFKAIEASFSEGGWSLARHIEIIPPAAASLVREDERRMAARAEVAALKLRESMLKANKSK